MTRVIQMPGRTMTPGRYKMLLKRWGMTQAQMAAFFGRAEAQGRAWAQQGPPTAVAMLLHLMDFLEMPPAEVDAALRSMTEPGRQVLRRY
jgi:hypothetical protein